MRHERCTQNKQWRDIPPLDPMSGVGGSPEDYETPSTVRVVVRCERVCSSLSQRPENSTSNGENFGTRTVTCEPPIWRLQLMSRFREVQLPGEKAYVGDGEGGSKPQGTGVLEHKKLV
jgi:hypothetical protein